MKKKISVLLAFVMLAVPGCGMNNNPSGTEREKDITTASETEKVTTTTTVASTTTAEVTTTTTTSTEIDTEAEKRFKVQEVLVSQLERSIEVDTFSFEYKAADGEAYKNSYHGIEVLLPDNIYAAAEIFNDIKKLYEASKNELSEYFDENGLILEKVQKLPRIDMYDIYSYEPNDRIEAYRFSKNWLISVDDGSVEFYEKNEQYTIFRNVLELLWKAQNEFPDISITALTEITVPYEIKQTLIIVCSSDDITPIGKYLTENGADLTGCLLLTPDEIQAKYDMYRHDKDVIYMYGLDDDTV